MKPVRGSQGRGSDPGSYRRGKTETHSWSWLGDGAHPSSWSWRASACFLVCCVFLMLLRKPCPFLPMATSRATVQNQENCPDPYPSRRHCVSPRRRPISHLPPIELNGPIAYPTFSFSPTSSGPGFSIFLPPRLTVCVPGSGLARLLPSPYEFLPPEHTLFCFLWL